MQEVPVDEVGLQPSQRFFALRYDGLPSSPTPVTIASEDLSRSFLRL
jgi:hypothetical protein